MKVLLHSFSITALALLLQGPVTSAAAPASVWALESGPIDPQRYFGATLANGVIGITSAPLPFRTSQALIYGAYDPLAPGSVYSLVRSFNLLSLAFLIDGERIERLEQTRNFRQRLDLKNAALITSFDYQDKAAIRYTIRALRHLPHTAMMHIEVTAKKPLSISPITVFDTSASFEAPALEPLRAFNGHESEVKLYDPSPRTVMLTAATTREPGGNVTIAAAQGFIFDEAPIAAPAVTRKEGALTFSRPLAAQERYAFALIASTITSAHVLGPVNEARRLVTAAILQGSGKLIGQHERAWAALWQSHIRIEGDPGAQRDVNSMLYHLYSSIREDSGYSIPPMGLSRSRTGYLGHIFWDAEVWMLPPLLALQPALARTILDYRFERLAEARKNAARNGYRGAQFPWESAVTGEEETWSSAAEGAQQHHPTAGVALAAWNYYCVTQDRDWLRERGYPLLKETADFWVSRVERNGPGRYDITHVVGADEYAKDVDNDAYTNAAAKENLAAAIAAAKILGLTPHADWQHVRENIPILRYPNGITRQHATYQGELIKQADVALLAYPLREMSDSEAIRRDLEFYDAHTDHIKGPAMTKSIYAILYQRLGMTHKAHQLFNDAYEPLKLPPFDILAENQVGKNAYFITAAGGLLQTLLYGFGGLHITEQGLVQRPGKLPPSWKSLTLTGIGPQRQTFSVPAHAPR